MDAMCTYQANGRLRCIPVINEHHAKETFMTNGNQGGFLCEKDMVAYLDEAPKTSTNSICAGANYDIAGASGVIVARNFQNAGTLCSALGDPKNPKTSNLPNIAEFTGGSFVVPLDANGIKNVTNGMSIRIAKNTAFNLAIFLKVPLQAPPNVTPGARTGGVLRISQCCYTGNHVVTITPQHFNAYISNNGASILVEAMAFVNASYAKEQPTGSIMVKDAHSLFTKILRSHPFPLTSSIYTPLPNMGTEIINYDATYAKIMPDGKLAWLNMARPFFVVRPLGKTQLGKSSSPSVRIDAAVVKMEKWDGFAYDSRLPVQIATVSEPRGYTCFAVINPASLQGTIFGIGTFEFCLERDGSGKQGAYGFLPMAYMNKPAFSYYTSKVYCTANTWQVVAFRVSLVRDQPGSATGVVRMAVFDSFCGYDDIIPMKSDKMNGSLDPYEGTPGIIVNGQVRHTSGTLGRFIGEMAHVQLFASAMSDDNIRGHITVLCERWGIRHNMRAIGKGLFQCK